MRDERTFDGDRGSILTSPDFTELWLEWMPRAVAYCRAFRGLSTEEREDLASEAILKAWSARARFDSSRPFAPWFLTILRRLALDQLARKSRLHEGQGSVESASSGAREAEDDALRDAEAAFVRGFVDALPERDRELASLVYGQGLKIGEAARVAGLPPGSAKWRLFEIRKSLKRAWEMEYGKTS